jgi:hypothetical protein
MPFKPGDIVQARREYFDAPRQLVVADHGDLVLVTSAPPLQPGRVWVVPASDVEKVA